MHGIYYDANDYKIFLINYLMYKVSKSLLESIMIAAKNSYPNEFAGLLGSSTETELVDDFIAVNSIQGSHQVLIKQHLLPNDFSIIGTVHSHPSNHSPSLFLL